jgi:hypothetical protein
VLGRPGLFTWDTGTYFFDTDNPIAPGAPPGAAACAGATTSPAPAPFAGPAHIRSSGTYTNIVCGTGWVHSVGPNTSVTQGGGVPGPNVTSAHYHDLFVGGEGLLVVTDATLSNGDHAEGYGWVSITPTSPVPTSGRIACVTDKATAFAAQGFFTIESATDNVPDGPHAIQP